jgi:acetolactate synthase-1/2/3 large subunit
MAMFKPVTKWNASIPSADVIPEAVRKAFKIAQTEKPGPTHLELPEDVADSIFDEVALRPLAVQAPVMPEPSPSQVQRAVRAISGAKRPVILAGNGVIRRNASEVVRSLARAFQIPVLQTFMAKGVMPDSDPLSLHTLGLTARDYAAVVMEQADAVLAIGYDFLESTQGQTYCPCGRLAGRGGRALHRRCGRAGRSALVAAADPGAPLFLVLRLVMGPAGQEDSHRWVRD